MSRGNVSFVPWVNLFSGNSFDLRGNESSVFWGSFLQAGILFCYTVFFQVQHGEQTSHGLEGTGAASSFTFIPTTSRARLSRFHPRKVEKSTSPILLPRCKDNIPGSSRPSPQSVGIRGHFPAPGS